MLTEEQLKKIQEAMKDTEFAKSVMETKTEEGLVSLLKDKKGITVSVEDIKDIIETVKQIPTEELDVSGGGFFGDLWQGAKNAVGQGEEDGDLVKTLKIGKGWAQAGGAYGTYIAGAAAVAALGCATYKGAKYAYDKIKEKQQTKAL